MSTLTKYTARSLVREIITIVAAVGLVLPFYILVMVALKAAAEAATTSPVVPPQNPTLQNFGAVFATDASPNVLSGLVNSMVITVGAVLLLVIFGSLAAYSISRRRTRMGAAAYLLFVVGIILPFQLGMIPTYIFFRSVGLLGTQIGMILLYSGLLMPLAVFLYTGFARALPPDYEEAASIDGASQWRIFRSVVFPLLAPATGTVMILTGIVIWNDFMLPLIFLGTSRSTTLPVVIYSFVGENLSEWNLIFAVVIIAMIPALLAFLFAQRRFIQGFAGGLKG
jgi:raffinose/stachyose/melibiose transport system permease protein